MTAAVLAVLLAAGCGVVRGAGKPASGPQASPEATATLRQDLERVRGDLAELRAVVEAQRRAATEHADRGVIEVRRELEAVQRALEAAGRHDAQRHVEVLDAQARRIDLLERRAAELGQRLHRLQLGVASLESQVGRLVDAAEARSSGGPGRAAPAAPARSTPAPGGGPPGLEPWPPRTAAERETGAPAPTSPAVTAAVGPSVAPSSATPARPPAPEKAAPADRPVPPDRPSGGDRPPAAATGTPPAPASRVEKIVPGASPSTARALFDRAMESWQKGEFGQAVLDFEELVQTFPGDPLVAPAQFWIGEAYFAARDFERAIVEYRKALDLAPRGAEAPRTLLRLGLAYRAQRREAHARQAWSTLVREFPSSDAAEEARRALRAR